MEKFKRAFHGYNVYEVNAYLDKTITQVESMINEIKAKDMRIVALEQELKRLKSENEKLESYSNISASIDATVSVAEKTAESIRTAAYRERDLIIENSKKNANRIINSALLQADKINNDSTNLKRNINIYKKRLRDVIETQLELVDDIDKIDL
jgi:cell division initiation protein